MGTRRKSPLALSGEARENQVMKDGIVQLNVVGTLGGTIRDYFSPQKFNTTRSYEIYYASKTGNEKKLQKLLDGPIGETELNFHNSSSGNTALHKATDAQSSICCYLLVFAGFDINATNNEGDTPLHIAIRNNLLEIAKFLIEHGANINIINQNGFSPLHMIARNGSLAILQKILSIFKEKQIRRKINSKLVTLIAIEVDLPSKDRKTALHLCSIDRGAFRKNNSIIVQELVTLGANLNAIDTSGNTPLHIAAYYGAWEICNILIEAGASKSARNFDNQIPFDLILTGLSLALSLGTIEKKFLHTKLIALLKEEVRGSPPTEQDKKSLPIDRKISQSSDRTKSKQNIRTKRRKSISDMLSYSIGLKKELDSFEIAAKVRKKKFIEDATVSVSNEIVLKIHLQIPDSMRSEVFLNFEKGWTVAEAKQRILVFLKKSPYESDDFKLYIPSVNNESDKGMQEDKLLSEYSLKAKSDLLFKNCKMHGDISSKSPANAKRKENAKKRKSLKQKLKYSTLRFSSNSNKGAISPNNEVQDDMPLLMAHKSSNTETQQIQRLSSIDDMLVPAYRSPKKQKEDTLDGNRVGTNANGTEKERKLFSETELKSRVDKAVEEATLDLKNKITTLENLITRMSNQRQAAIALPRNQLGKFPADVGIWYPTNVNELQYLRTKEELEVLCNAKEPKSMDQNYQQNRLQNLLDHYQIVLPTFFSFSDSLQALNNYIICGSVEYNKK